MADKKITDLTNQTTPPNDADVFPFVDVSLAGGAGVTKKVPFLQISNGVKDNIGGTASGDMVQLETVSGTVKIPALDGSQLTNLPDSSTNVTLANTNYLSISGQEITGGTVPVASGGTGATSASAARSALGVDASGTDNSTNVTLANTNYLSISGQEITGGTVPVASGGTGATSASAARTALGIGTAGVLDVGTSANNVVQLTSASKLPAVDGSLLTNLPAGTVNNSTFNASGGEQLSVAKGGTGGTTASAARTSLGAQASSVRLTEVAGVGTPGSNTFLGGDGTNLILRSATGSRTALGLGTAATKDVGTGANNVLQLDSNSKIPAVDGSLITNLPAGTVNNSTFNATGGEQLSIAKGGTGGTTAATARGNLGLGTAAIVATGTSSGNVPVLDSNGKLVNSVIPSPLPAVDGSNLTNISATDSTKLAISSNLSDLNDKAAARTALQLGTAAQKDSYDGSGTAAAGNVVALTNDGGTLKLPALNASLLTGIAVSSDDIDASVVKSNRGVSNPHIGAYPNQPFKALQSDNTAFVRVVDQVLQVVGDTETTTFSVGVVPYDDPDEPDIEFIMPNNRGRRSATSGDSDVMSVYGQPKYNQFQASIGAATPPLLISGGTF